MVVEKKALRRLMIEARQALSPEERRARSLQAQRVLLDSPLWDRVQWVLLYLPIRGEVETSLLVERGLAQGKRILLPRVEQASRHLWLHRWTGDPGELTLGAYGIQEPRADLPLVPPEEVELAMLPGVAFDRQGYRLGYGGGYYDRALPGMSRAVRLGLAFSLQVVEELVAEPHDARLHGLVTEEGLTWVGEPHR